jgi:SAM-dependent methyltransferase
MVLLLLESSARATAASVLRSNWGVSVDCVAILLTETTMLGTSLDYMLLRALAHSRNKATEDELNGSHASSLEPEQLTSKLPKIIDRYEGHFPIDPRLRYLDMGCGSGELTLGLAKMGLPHIVGVDVMPRFVNSARENARALGLADRVEFVCADLRTWRPAEPFDVLFSFDALEHIDTPREFMATMADFLAPGGVAVLAFGPLFHSPFGDHMYDFFKVQVPWRGVLFSEEALLRVRRECYRPTDGARRYGEIAGGLNLMRYSEFLDHVRATGWEFDYLRPNSFLRRGALRKVSDTVMAVPGVRDYFVHNVYATLRRARGTNTIH